MEGSIGTRLLAKPNPGPELICADHCLLLAIGPFPRLHRPPSGRAGPSRSSGGAVGYRLPTRLGRDAPCRCCPTVQRYRSGPRDIILEIVDQRLFPGSSSTCGAARWTNWSLPELHTAWQSSHGEVGCMVIPSRGSSFEDSSPKTVKAVEPLRHAGEGIYSDNVIQAMRRKGETLLNLPMREGIRNRPTRDFSSGRVDGALRSVLLGSFGP
jgi:hypothetical protein